MPNYILRTHPFYTLVLPDDPDTVYRNGDPITLSEEDAKRIAYGSKFHRFEMVGSANAPLVGHDRHRSGRHLRGEAAAPLPGSDQDTTSTT